MKRFFALLLLAGCGSETDEAAQEQAGTPVEATANQAAAAEDPAALQARAVEALAAILVDPAKGRYANLRRGTAGALCGSVDPARRGGGFLGARPFLVTPQGAAFISGAQNIAFGDPTDPFPDLYMRWCASPEELRTIGSIAAAGAPAEDLADIPDIPAGVDIGLPANTIGEPAEPAPPPAPVLMKPVPLPPPETAPPPPGDDSFANAVIRKKEG